MKAFFSPKYTLDLGDHVFPTQKFALTARALVERGILSAQDLEEREPASRQDLLLAHHASWVDRVLEGRLKPQDLEALELPWSEELVLSHRTCAQGTVLACRQALECGLGLHIGGGSHHAGPVRGEGFCVFNDIALGILKMQSEGRIRRAAVVDLDVHQGNGTAAIFAGRTDVFTFSIHEQDNYPPVKTPGSLDIGLQQGTTDAEYIAVLGQELPRILDLHRPELVVYQAGVDCFEKDLLGGFKLTEKGLIRRDRLVFEQCFQRRIPVAVTLGGGYAVRLQDSVRLHVQTVETAIASHRRFWHPIKVGTLGSPP